MGVIGILLLRCCCGDALLKLVFGGSSLFVGMDVGIREGFIM